MLYQRFNNPELVYKWLNVISLISLAIASLAFLFQLFSFSGFSLINPKEFPELYGNFSFFTAIILGFLSLALYFINSVFIKKMALEYKGNYFQILAMKREMNELHDIKQNLLSIIAHEIKTPITGIMSISEILKQESDNNETLELAEELYIRTKSIYQTFQNIFEYYEINEKSIETKENKINVNALLESLKVKFSVKAIQKGLDLEIVVPEDEVFVKTYASVLRKSLIILINKALKFTSVGKITLKLQVYNDEISISVSDTGVGIDNNESEKIFEPFYQESKGLNRKYEGLGLSLNLCKKYCRLIGAKLLVSLEKNLGSTFTIALRQNL